MPGIIRHLHFTAAVCLLNSLGHCLGLIVCVHDHGAGYVTGSTPDSLDQRTIGSQEPLFIGVKYGNQGNFGKVQAFTQEVDPHDNVDLPFAQLAQQLHPA